MSRLFRNLAVVMLAALMFCGTSSVNGQIPRYLPDETAPHEGTWLQWPHHYTYGTQFRNQIESSWIAMTKVLVQSERVHIIAYSASEVNRIRSLLSSNGVPLEKVDFLVRKTDDYWVRDNGPFFVIDDNGDKAAVDFNFNGWGEKQDCDNDRGVAGLVAAHTETEVIETDLVLEGGGLEVDGAGTAIITESCVLNKNRNPGLAKQDCEDELKALLGLDKIIWLPGVSVGEVG